jgi:DNA-binding IclR family transcriptional regulator
MHALASTPARPAPTRTVDRALDLLAAVAERGGGATLAELARVTELSASTALRLLSTLAARGFVERHDDGRFVAGPALRALAFTASRGDPLYELAGPHLAALAQATGETSNLAIAADARRALYLRQVASPRLVQTVSWTGCTIPRRGTAVGAALSGRVRFGEWTSTRRTIEPDVTAVAAPVFGADGRVACAISVIAPSYRTTDDDVAAHGEALVGHATAMSTELGWTRSAA